MSGLCVTKLDVMDGMDEIRLCVGYKKDGQIYDILPFGAENVMAASRFTKPGRAGRKPPSA